MSQPTSATRPEGEELDRLVSDLLADLADRDPGEVSAGDQLRDLDLDSLDVGELVVQLNEHLGLPIDAPGLADDWAGMTVGQVVEAVRAELRRAAGPSEAG